MNSSFSLSLVSDPKTLLNNTGILEELLIAFTEYIAKREKEPLMSLKIDLVYLPKEKKN